MRIVYCHFLASCIIRFVFRPWAKSNYAQKKRCVGELLGSASVQTVYIFPPFSVLFLSFFFPFSVFFPLFTSFPPFFILFYPFSTFFNSFRLLYSALFRFLLFSNYLLSFIYLFYPCSRLSSLLCVFPLLYLLLFRCSDLIF